MAYFKTGYDASTMTVSVNDEEVYRALGILADKAPAALKVAVNTTARQTRKLMLQEVKNRYDLNAAGKRMIEDLRQRQKATNRRPAAILAIMKNDPGAFPGRLGLFPNQPHETLHGTVCPQCATVLSGARPERQPDDRPRRNQRKEQRFPCEV